MPAVSDDSDQRRHDVEAGDRPRMRVLFIAEAVTLAHVARVHALAQLLDANEYDVCIAADPRYDGLIGEHAFATRRIDSVSTDRFAKALEKGAPIYDVATLARYVDDDARTIDSFAPDVVIGDFRLSLNVSARLAGKPYVNITNAGWSPFGDTRFTVPDIAITRWFGAGIAQRLFDLTRPVAFAAHARPLNTLRRRFGMTPLSHDLRVAYTDADQVLYADIPELFPTRGLPPNHEFLGAILWAPATAAPPWWDALPTDRPIVYLTLGSSGKSSVLATTIEALAMLPVTVVVATAGRVRLERVPANAFVADYLDGTLAARRASLVICNGGSPTCYQALAAGVPVLGIPTNLDQFLNMAALEASGAGAMVRTAQVTRPRVARVVESLLDDRKHRASALQLQTGIQALDPRRVLDRTLRKFQNSTCEK